MSIKCQSQVLNIVAFNTVFNTFQHALPCLGALLCDDLVVHFDLTSADELLSVAAQVEIWYSSSTETIGAYNAGFTVNLHRPPYLGFTAAADSAMRHQLRHALNSAHALISSRCRRVAKQEGH
jgi:hypothetical protein